MSYAPRLAGGGGVRPRRGLAVDAARYDDEGEFLRAVLPPRRLRELGSKVRRLAALYNARIVWRRAHRTRVD